jgi:hypothetical protein
MARRSNKLTIHVSPARTAESITFRTTGKFGRKVLSIGSTKIVGVPLSPTATTGAYWIDVMNKVIAEVALLP